MKRILSLVFLAATVAGCSDIQPQLSFNDPNIAQDNANKSEETQKADQGLGSSVNDSNIPAGATDATTQVAVKAKTNPDEIYCPTGSWYSPSEKLCVTENQALGPFTNAMIGLCKKYGGGNQSCESSRWERRFAVRLRLDGQCPRGATFDSTRFACVEDQQVYGPFKVRDVDECRRKGGGPACDTMRWNVSFLSARVQGGTSNKKLFDFYKIRANYDDVYDEVLTFYPSGRRNGCVAFMSTALRMSGTAVPVWESINGETISLVTKPFARYLQERLGWTKITSANNLQPGDVVLTEDDARYPGYPAHTYMFYGWSNQKGGIGWVIDNQDFIHERNIFGYGTYNFTPFAYALRSPE